MARPTLKSIAQRTGYSLTTISRALKDGPEVKPETIAKVKAVAEELGYRPDTSGLRLRTGKTFVICAIMPMMSMVQPEKTAGDLGALRLINGLMQGLDGTNYHLMVLPDSGGGDRLKDVRYVVESGIADGLVLNLTRPDDIRVRYLQEKNFPFITFGRTELSFEHPYFDVDNVDYAYRAAVELYKKGRKNIRLVVSDMSYCYCNHQWIGFKRASLEYGIEVSKKRNLVEESQHDSFKRMIDQTLDKDSTIDGFICPGEIPCLGILAALRESNVVIGDSLDVVTLESSPLTDFLGEPIANFYQDSQHAGQQLTSLLLKAIDGAPLSELQKLTVASQRNSF